jgi:hypothetical protein
MDMSPNHPEEFDLAGLLQLSQWRRGTNGDGGDSQTNYRDLLRYTLQIAVEREVAADVLAELRSLLEEYAPAWYAEDQHQRVDSVLQLLHKL